MNRTEKRHLDETESNIRGSRVAARAQTLSDGAARSLARSARRRHVTRLLRPPRLESDVVGWARWLEREK